MNSKNVLRNITPSVLWEFLHKIQLKLKQHQYKSQLKKNIPTIPSKGIYLNYGGVLGKDLDKIIHGGKVKLIHLNQVFPESSDQFNILYLVSSAQPPFALEMVRWAKKQGVKFVWNQDGVAYPAWTSREASRTGNRNMGSLIQQADHVIYQSEFCRQSADRFLRSVSVPQTILCNCVDTDLFFPSQPELPAPPWILLTAGTHQQAERIVSVLQTVAILKERKRPVLLILVGRLDWPLADQEVKETISKLRIKERVDFRPAYSQADAPALFRQAHIFLHSKYKDPCPTVVIEALASGLPVIGSNSGGMPELVGEEGGILIDVPESWDQMQYPSPEKMADAVETIFQDLPGRRQKARQRAIRYFNKKSWIDRHQNIFQTVLK